MADPSTTTSATDDPTSFSGDKLEQLSRGIYASLVNADQLQQQSIVDSFLDESDTTLSDDQKLELKTQILESVKKIRDVYNTNYDEANAQRQLSDANKDYQKAMSDLQSSEAQKLIASTLANALTSIDDANKAKIAGLNADTMTAKRIGTIYSQNLIRTRNISDNLKLSIVFVCFAIILTFLATKGIGIVSLPMAEMGVFLLALVCAGILISRLLSNLNRYNMLTQERVFRWQEDTDDDAAEDAANANSGTQCTQDADGNYLQDTSAFDLLQRHRAKMIAKANKLMAESVGKMTAGSGSDKCECPTEPAAAGDATEEVIAG